MYCSFVCLYIFVLFCFDLCACLLFFVLFFVFVVVFFLHIYDSK